VAEGDRRNWQTKKGRHTKSEGDEGKVSMNKDDERLETPYLVGRGRGAGFASRIHCYSTVNTEYLWCSNTP
jgi:hypothetical protein